MATSQSKMLFLSGLLILSLCACQNTIHGVGDDIAATGNAIAGKK